jgi:hypothetical protein
VPGPVPYTDIGGGGSQPPHGEDFFNRIVNVHWRKRVPSAVAPSVIVVFVDGVTLEAQPASLYVPQSDGVSFLKSWRTPYQAEGFQPGYNTEAYLVSSSAGFFMASTTPNTRGSDDSDFGCWQTCAVFALDKFNIAASLADAEDGIKQIIPAAYMLSRTGESDLPAVMCPPGLLWLVEAVPAPSKTSFSWKIRYGKHRADSETSPPNDMVQCYPLSDNYFNAVYHDTVSGYRIYGYRLDGDGIGRVYGEQQLDDENTHDIADGWDVPIVEPGADKGIPFQDPPPLIGADV